MHIPAARLSLLVALSAFTVTAFANPILPAADPDVAIVGKMYWMYPTNDNGERETFHAYASPDLRTWQDRGIILKFKDVSWINADGRKHHGAWAPTILAAHDKYYFYYAVGPQTDDIASRIGVAVATAPQGPFIDSGKPLINDGGHGFEAIDPMAFTDPKTNITYLYAGGSAGAKLRVWELGDDLISLKREIEVATPPQFTEGAFMHLRDGTYYLSYSHGRYNDADYAVHYATAASPTGPWTYRSCILASDATHKGPGHHSFVQNPSTGDWFIVYHRWETTAEHGPFKGKRQIAIEPLKYNDDGTIQPVKMTDGPTVQSPIP